MNSAAETAFDSVLRENYELLSRCLVVSNRLLFRLKSVDYMRDKVPQIRQQTTADLKVTELLNVLDEVPDNQQQSVFSALLSALRNDGQEHVANIFLPESGARPMSDEHYEILIDKQDELRQFTSPNYALMDRVVSSGLLGDNERESVMSKSKYSEMSLELVKILQRKPDGAFDKFIQALKATDQHHVVYILTGEGDADNVRPMSDEHNQLLLNKTEELRQFINPTYALMSSLVRDGVLDQYDKERIMSRLNYSEMSLELVNILQRKADSAFDKFIHALKAADQHHVVNILTGEGNEGPLSRLRRQVLIKARKYLVRKVEIQSTLVAELVSNGVLNEVDMLRIEAQQTSGDKIGVLIDAIARKSQSAYDKFVQAFKHKDIDQPHIARLLEGLELKGLVEMNFKDDEQQAVENKIIKIVRDKMKALISGNDRDVEELSLLMERNGFAVSEITEGSIHISFRCFTRESLVNLRRVYSDKTLDRLFSQTFCAQFTKRGLKSLELHITEDEFQKLTETFCQIEIDNQLDEDARLCSLAADEQKCEQLTSQTVSYNTNDIRIGEPADQSLGLPMEMLELVLMKAFIALFNDYYKTSGGIRLAYSTLAAVCYDWWQTMNGWPQAPTPLWLKHKLRSAVKYVCRPYYVSPRLKSTFDVSGLVFGVAACDNKLFVVCSKTIFAFGPNNKQLTRIELGQLKFPRDIVSCTETQQLFVAGVSRDTTRCVWRVSLDGSQVVKWLPNKSTTSEFRPWTLSVTSRRLLVTSCDNHELLLYGADGVELKRVSLPDMAILQHAVETSRGTFIVSDNGSKQPKVCEVNTDGHVICVFCDPQQLHSPAYLSLDSDGRIFVADTRKHRVLLLNSETLEPERVLLDTQQHQFREYPWRLCYREETGQLALSGNSDWNRSTVDRRVMPDFVQLFTVR